MEEREIKSQATTNPKIAEKWGHLELEKIIKRTKESPQDLALFHGFRGSGCQVIRNHNETLQIASLFRNSNIRWRGWEHHISEKKTQSKKFSLWWEKIFLKFVHCNIDFSVWRSFSFEFLAIFEMFASLFVLLQSNSKERCNEEQRQEKLFPLCGSHFAAEENSSHIRKGYAISSSST